MNKSGLPITYRLFEGNTNDCETLMPVLDDLKDDYGLKRIIVVADKGMNTGKILLTIFYIKMDIFILKQLEDLTLI